MQLVKMKHPTSATDGYSTVPKRSFDEYWSAKGWVLVGEQEPEPEAEDEGEFLLSEADGVGAEPDTNTQED